MNLPNAYRVTYMPTGHAEDTQSSAGTYYLLRDQQGTLIYWRDTKTGETFLDGYVPDAAGCFVSVFTFESAEVKA